MPGGINVPLDVILAWPIPNYKDPSTQPRYVLAFSCIIGPISIAFLCARLWVRIHMQRNAGWDDWLMLAAAVSASVATDTLAMLKHSVAYAGSDHHISFK